MSVKIYGVSLNDIKLSKDLDVPLGPGFYIDRNNISLSTLYPVFIDYSSMGITSYDVNMGQRSFIGDPLGFLPYDVSYASNKYQGGYTSLGGSQIQPDNTSTLLYNHTYSSGKYYYEVTVITGGYYGGIGFAPTNGGNRVITDGIGIMGIGDYRNIISYTSDIRTQNEGIYDADDDFSYVFGNYSVDDNDVLQVWVDFDNNLMCIKKLGTTKENHINYIEF